MNYAKLKLKRIHCLICNQNRSEVLNQFPWADAMFDVQIIIVRDELINNESVHSAVDKLVLANTDWFSVYGASSEQLHDYIDEASVRLGRQEKVGDGAPMTAWFEDVMDIRNMLQGFDITGGGCNFRVILIIGDNEDTDRFIKLAKKMYIRQRR